MAARLTAAGRTAAAPVSIRGCQGCGACLLTCPARAIRPAFPAPVVLPGRCDGCGECVEICPVGAIGWREEER